MTGSAQVSLDSLAERYLQAIIAGDRTAALHLVLVEGVKHGVPVPALHLDVIQRAQREVGRLWQENRITVAQEHLATAISQLAVAQLYTYLPRDPRNGRRIVLACPSSELHELGARIAADFLEMAGFSVHFLGANVPPESLAAMVASARPDLVVISATTSLCFPALREALQALRDAAPDVPVVVGGSAFTWSDACDVPHGVIHGGNDARDLVRVARELLAA